MSLNGTTAAFKQLKLADLTTENSVIRQQIASYEAHNDAAEEGRISRKCKNAVRAMILRADSTELSLVGLADAKHDQEQISRFVQAETGVYRQPYKPDLAVVAATFGVCGVIETVFTTFTIAADGSAGILSAAATGLVTTSVNLGMGCFGGYASRYIGYGASKPIRKNSDFIKHYLGTGVSSISLLGAGLMSFGAARVRAVGDHKGILDFDKVSLFATYNDHLSLATSIIGLLVFGVSFLKGRVSLVDKHPQLAEIARDLSNDTDHDAIEVTQSALEAVDQILSDVENAFIVSTPLAEEQTDIDASIIDHVSNIKTAKDECLTVHAQEHQRECFVKGRASALPEFDLSEFDRLQDGLELRPRFKPNEDGLEAVKTAHSQSVTKILQAHADYLASSKSYRVSPPNQSTTL